MDPLGLAESSPSGPPSADQYLESADLSSGRLRLSGCGYQGRKNRQTALYSQEVLDYLQNTEEGQQKVEKTLKRLNWENRGEQFDSEFARYYLLQQKLTKFEKKSMYMLLMFQSSPKGLTKIPKRICLIGKSPWGF